ncbi:hypothetical protein [Sphingobium olei]|uniref:Uncharacterized protein n=1 Tax=Sphingobium olei TaxID=420955 RepID=A0ABW3NWR5_9SPHN
MTSPVSREPSIALIAAERCQSSCAYLKSASRFAKDCLPLIYWLNRIWMMARRGEVEGDPVAFAIKDRRSILVGGAMACIFAAALYGPAAAP